MKFTQFFYIYNKFLLMKAKKIEIKKPYSSEVAGLIIEMSKNLI